MGTFDLFFYILFSSRLTFITYCFSVWLNIRRHDNLVLAEHKHGQKDETEDFAFCEAPEEPEGDSPGTTEAGKRNCSEMEPDSKQFSSGKRVKVAEEVSFGFFHR